MQTMKVSTDFAIHVDLVCQFHETIPSNSSRMWRYQWASKWLITDKNRISENNAYKLLCRQWFWSFLCSTYQLLVGRCEWNVLHQSNSDWWLNNEQMDTAHWFHCFILVMFLELSSLMSHKFLLLIKMWYDINYRRSYNTHTHTAYWSSYVHTPNKSIFDTSLIERKFTNFQKKYVAISFTIYSNQPSFLLYFIEKGEEKQVSSFNFNDWN